MKVLLSATAVLVACTSAPVHPSPIGDCPPGDRCNTTVGGGDHVLPEGGGDASDASVFDATGDAVTPPIDAPAE